jgi:hypothetical protein
MSKIIGFIKSNLVIVISVVLILAFLPTGYIFAGKWNAKVKDEANSAYTGEKRKLTSKGSINYSLPAVLEGEEDLSESRAPNNMVTQFYQARKAEREQQVQEVVERGTAFNQGDHVELVPGILPQAADDRTLVRLAREMAEAIAGTNANPSVYQRKLQRLNAGSPPDSVTMASTLEEYKSREQLRYEGSNADGKITTAQLEQLGKDLTSRRLGEYIGRSKALTFYCSPDAFVNGTDRGSASSNPRAPRGSQAAYSIVPAHVPALSTIDETLVFNWLWDFWMISDVLDAAALANSNPQTGAMSIPDAAVKSIEQIRVSKLDLTQVADAVVDDLGGGQRGSRNDPPPTQSKDAPKGTFTGRVGGMPNSAFDIRMIELVVVASSQDLPRYIDALGKTNYMTVTDLDLAEVDIWGDLEQGYYYGDNHVVRATITIESVWLRSWMKPIMPDPIKLALGIPLENAPEDSDG